METLSKLFDITDSLYATLFILMLYWANKKIKVSEDRAERREERLSTKIDEIEQRYYDREQGYQAMMSEISKGLAVKISTVEQDIKEIKTTLLDTIIKNEEVQDEKKENNR